MHQRTTGPSDGTSRPVGQELTRALQERFGFRRFRPGQRQAVESAIRGRDTLVLMPTGSGKSLCFQLPALELPGTTIVVSPLIALMKDQADALRRRGIRVAVVNSTLTPREEAEVLAEIAANRVEFVYTTPERMGRPDFRALLRSLDRIDLFVVDEAHCISQWGHDFRPEYLALGRAIEELGHPPVLALTATATRDVIDDILEQLDIPDAEVVDTGFYRPNLFLEVVTLSDESERRALLARLLEKNQTIGSGIVYTATVKAVRELTEMLVGLGLSVAPYHGRMKAADRIVNQDRFMRGEVLVMVATNAFGLGIDKPDIRYVIHHHMPGTIEAYYQEFGRAGRDGRPARCTLLYRPEDQRLQRFFQSGRFLDGQDLVNAHHALKRLSKGPKPPNLKELQAISPLPKSRLKVALALLIHKRVVGEVEGRRFVLLQPDVSPDEMERLAGVYRERHERELLNAQRMVEYAETRNCRWSNLLDDFDQPDELPGDRCGHCDRCEAASNDAPP